VLIVPLLSLASQVMTASIVAPAGTTNGFGRGAQTLGPGLQLYLDEELTFRLLNSQSDGLFGVTATPDGLWPVVIGGVRT
jgi:hypothetical protein